MRIYMASRERELPEEQYRSGISCFLRGLTPPARLAIALIACLFARPAFAADEDLAKKAQAALKSTCYRCHGQEGAVEGGMNYILDLDKLVQRRKVIPGKAAESPLWKKIASGQMPPADEQPRPSDAEKEIIRKWIDAGAPGVTTTVENRQPIRESDVVRFMLSDLEAVEPRSRRFARYFSLAHLYNAGLGDDELQTYRNALSKLINSLSWHPKISIPVAIDPHRTVFRIDLRWYMWDAILWNRLLQDYPYGVFLDTATARAVAVSTATRLPVVRGDWFLATASRAPLYYELLQIPTSLAELERTLRVDAAVNIQQERVARAGFNGSGVSRNNRILERHDSVHGAYWRTYDFDAVPQNLIDRKDLLPDQRNIFAYPLGPAGTTGVQNPFLHGGGEAIFSLPNGLHAFVIVNNQGVRIDKAPQAVVSDPKRPDRAVEAGLSCMSCHVRGINPKEDQVREFVEKNPKAFGRNDTELIKALYIPKDKMTKLMEADAAAFQAAVVKTGGKISAFELISTMVQRYEADLDLASTAAELSLSPEELLQKMSDSAAVARNFGSLKVTGGTVARTVLIQAYGDLVKDLRLGILLQPNQLVQNLRDNTGEIDPLEGGSQLANAMAFSPDQRYALFASADKTVRLWDFDANRELRRFVGHGASVWSVAISPDSKFGLSGSADQSIRLWDVSTGREIRKLAGHTGVVNAIAFSPDGTRALSASYDQAVILWDVNTGKELQHLDGVPYVHALTIMPDGKHALLAAGKWLRVLDLDEGKWVARLEGHTEWIVSLALSPDGKKAITGGDDRAIRVWDLESRQCIQTLTGHEGPVKSVAFSVDGKQAVSGGVDAVLRVWDLASGKETARFSRHKESVISVAFNADASKTISGSSDSEIKLWKVPGR